MTFMWGVAFGITLTLFIGTAIATVWAYKSWEDS